MLLAAIAGIAALPGSKASAQSLSGVLGATHIDGKYYFTNEDYLNEGADQVLATGSRVVKVQMGASTVSKYPWNASWPGFSSLSGLAATPYFQSFFAKPFQSYIITAYQPSVPGGGDPAEYWLNGMTAAQKTAETKGFYDLTKYLMQTYAGTGKTFVMEQWEGDWALRDGGPNPNHTNQPSPTAVQGMIDWINARQAGISAARAQFGASSNVKVYQALEVNRVIDAMNEGSSFTWATVTNDVLPYTNVDLASYSSYDTQYNTSGTTSFANAVQYIANHLPLSAVNGQNLRSVGVGEFGVPEDTKGAGSVNLAMNNVINTVVANDMPYAMYWEIYSNELKSGFTPPVNGNNAAVNGFWMVKPDGTPGTAWHQYRYQLATNDPKRSSSAAIARNLNLAYASNFHVPGATLGANWTTNTSGGAMSVGLSGGQMQMSVASNAGSSPIGQATLNIAAAIGRGLNPGEFLQFTLNRQSAAGVIGVSAFGANHGSGNGSGNQPLEVFSNSAWTPISFTASGSNPTYNWDTADSLGLRLDSADGHFATISYYVNGNYSGSWLYQTAATSLSSFSLFAQSSVLNSGFGFNNLTIYTSGGGIAGTNFYWDPIATGTSSGGGNGTWDAGSTAHFFNGFSDVTWNNATLGDNTIFGGTPGTVTVAAGGVNASNLIFNSANYVLSGGTITMMGRQTINAASGPTTINNPIAGTSGLNVVGNGSLILGGANSFTGGLWISNGGTVRFTADNNLGAANQPVILDGGKLIYTGNVANGLTVPRNFTIGAGGGTFDIPNSGQSPSNGKLVINGNNRITGAGNITKVGQGWLTLYGSNASSYSGNWIVNDGVLEVGSAQVLGTGSVSINNGGEIATNVAGAVSNPITLNSGATIGADFFGVTSTGTFSGPISANGAFNARLGNFYSNTSQNLVLSGKISGAGSMTITPALGTSSTTGKLTLLGDNSAFSGGIVIPTGTVAAGLSAGKTLGTGRITLAGGKLALQGQLAPIGPAGSVGAIAASGFNKDVLYAASEIAKYPSGDNLTNTLMDGSFSYYQNGYTPPAGQLSAGSILTGGIGANAFVSAVNGTPFSLQNFTASNALQINQGGMASLSLSAPTAYTKLSILAASVFAQNDKPAVTIHFTDGTSVSTSYNAYDWSINGDATKLAANAIAGGINRYGPTQSPGWDQRPFGMYQTDIDLTNIGGVDYSNKLVASLNFAATSSDPQNRGRTDIFAISGAARSLLTGSSQTYSNDVLVSADSGIDVSGSLNATLGALTLNSAKLSITSSDSTVAGYSLGFGATSVSGNTSIDVANSAGGGSGSVSLGVLSGAGALTKSGPGMLVLTGGGSISGALSVTGGIAQLGGSMVSGGATTSSGGKLDVADKNLRVNYTGSSPLASIAQQIASGYAAGAWNGPGINSLAAALVAGDSSNLHKTGLGYFDDGASVLIDYTLLGDANVDGSVDTADFNNLASNFGRSGQFWSGGDFNYDGVIDTTDFNILASNFGNSMPAEAGTPGTPAGAFVPEPSFGALGLLCASLICKRRRRR